MVKGKGNKVYKIPKFDEDKRTFRTRLAFIQSIFAHKYTETDIIASCIEHKLNRSYEQYLRELNTSFDFLKSKDPIKVLKKIKK